MFTLTDPSDYSTLVWDETLPCNEGFVPPTEEEILSKLEEIKKEKSFELRLSEYPSAEEWIIAYIQKELDDQPDEWNNLVEKRSAVKQKYPK